MSFDIGRIEKASRRIDKFLKKNPKTRQPGTFIVCGPAVEALKPPLPR